MRFIRLMSGGVVGFLASCAAPSPPPPSMMSIYEAAIQEAAVKRPADLGAHLLPITGKTVEVATWASDLDSRSAEKGARTLGDDVWVTLVPELKRHCAGLTGTALSLRLQELLGMPPVEAAGWKVFIFTVSSADVFRPCGDPSVTTTSCTLDVPDAGYSGLTDATAAAHLRFVLRQILSSYRVGFDPPGYPFTALGYTYDWKPDSETHHVGLSEYVVRHGAVVRDLQEVGTDDYCARS